MKRELPEDAAAIYVGAPVEMRSQMPASSWHLFWTGPCDFCGAEIFCSKKQREQIFGETVKIKMACLICMVEAKAMCDMEGYPTKFHAMRSPEISKHFNEG